jgi:hypothetical protein
VVDANLEVWDLYGNRGWPARYLFGPDGMLTHYHYGEGAYAETERAIQSLLGIDGEVLPPLRPEDEPGAPLAAQSEDVPGPYSGPYAAGGVWAVLEGRGEVQVNGGTIVVDAPGAYPLLEHYRHTVGELEFVVGDGVTCHAVCFTPGVADDVGPSA